MAEFGLIAHAAICRAAARGGDAGHETFETWAWTRRRNERFRCSSRRMASLCLLSSSTAKLAPWNAWSAGMENQHST